jgi:lipopolysaccharide biosynthesis regulator YciM
LEINIHLILGISAAFLAGALLGIWMRRRGGSGGKSLSRKGDKAFFKGIQYILSNDHDQAIEEFTKSVKINSETIETYVALANLYRSKGAIDRAIRIRRSIILRPHIDEQIKLKVLFDLALDYRKGGFFSRALDTFREVARKDPSDLRTLEEMERIYEELKDWERAFETRKKIAKVKGGDHNHIMAHHLVEMGKVQQEAGELVRAISLYNKAISTEKSCVDAYLHLGDLYFERGEYKRAVSTWKKVVQVAPRFTFLAYRRLEGAYAAMDNLEPVGDFLKACADSSCDAFTYMALARYLYNEKDIDGALEQIESALKLDSSFWEARRFKGEILLRHDRRGEALADYEDLIGHLDVPYLRFQCAQCGYLSNELAWQCPQCRRWDTIHLLEKAGAGSAS